MSICKQCGAPIEWIAAANFLVPVDAEPILIVEGNSPQRFLTDEGKVLTGRPASRDEESPDLPVAFVPHWRTCRRTFNFWWEPDKPP